MRPAYPDFVLPHHRHSEKDFEVSAARSVWGCAYVAFSPEDAKRRFISENPALWADIEVDLKLKPTAQNYL